ncbi:Cytochrome c oxidase subunit 6C [Frankliniella fusca]|uniref:Cytochrome c oxidase subunit 6C n=1 Tax=Frankliniella fusca TaxID=407009 RepID=A0AAE1HZI2_9NEOP|nr:Cytochrome c oxidase subunit 6C [Frankliniella fusca]
MSGGAVARLAKPKLRGHFRDALNKNLLYSGIGGGIAAVAYYFLQMVPHAKRREEYMSINPAKEFERLRDLGFFWSVPPKDPSKALYEWKKED